MKGYDLTFVHGRHQELYMGGDSDGFEILKQKYICMNSILAAGSLNRYFTHRPYEYYV